MADIFSRAGAQTVNQRGYANMVPNYHSPQMDPSEFQRFMQHPKEQQQTMKNDSYYSVNSAQVNNKQDYARILKQQIEEKQTLKRLQDSTNQNYFKVTGYHPSIVEQTLHQSKQNDLQTQIEQQQLLFHPVTYQQKNYQQTVNDTQVKQNLQDQPRNVRGIFAREMYQTIEQASVKEIQNQTLRSDLLRQMDEKRAIKDLERQKREIEDIIYMDKIKQQQEELGQKIPESDNKISNLRFNNNVQSQMQSQPSIKELKQLKQPQAQPQEQQGSSQAKYNYTPMFIPPQTREQVAYEHPLIEELKQRLQEIVERQPQQVINYAQSEVNYDFMKQNYQYQQVEFDRDMSFLKNQINKTDMGRFNAEKELVYLQERARDKRIQNVLNNDSDFQMQNNQPKNRGIFRTAKYAMENTSEGERRQQILQEYYKQDRNQLSLGPLNAQQYPQESTAIIDGQQLQTETRMILAQSAFYNNEIKLDMKKTKDNNILIIDKELEQQINSIQNHDKLVVVHSHQKLLGKQIKDKAQYIQMLKENSLIEVFAAMKIKGDKKTMTPSMLDQRFKIQDMTDITQIKRLNSQGNETDVIFTQNLPQRQNNQQDNKSQESSVYDYPDEQTKTEDIINSVKIEKISPAPKVQFAWEENFVEDTLSEVDPIDQKIGGMLENIKTIVNNKQDNYDYYTFQTQMRAQTIIDSKSKQQSLDQRQNLPHWKPITFEKKKQIANENPIVKFTNDSKMRNTLNQSTQNQLITQNQISNQTQKDNHQNIIQQKKYQDIKFDEGVDHIDRIDTLLKNFST